MSAMAGKWVTVEQGNQEGRERGDDPTWWTYYGIVVEVHAAGLLINDFRDSCLESEDDWVAEWIAEVKDGSHQIVGNLFLRWTDMGDPPVFTEWEAGLLAARDHARWSRKLDEEKAAAKAVAANG